MNVAVGGNWPGDPDDTTVYPQTMEWIISGFSNSQQTVLSCWGEVIIHLILTNQFLEFDEFSEGKTFRKDSS